MNPLEQPEATAAAITIAAGTCGRIAGAVCVGTLPVLPGTSLRIRAALVLALTVVAAPMAWTVQAASTARPAGPLVAVVAGELLIGLLMGTAAAAVISAAGWAGAVLGSVSGLSWADDFDPEAAGQTAGIARLSWWIGLAAFLAAGGHLAIVGGLVDSVRHAPVGCLGVGPPPQWLSALALRVPATGFSLAVMLAMPALVAVVAFHLASTVCLRAVPFATGPGLLQGLASLVLLGCLWLGAEAWTRGGAPLALGLVADCFLGGTP